jgi:hypothetical protein
MSKASQAGGKLDISNSKQMHIALKRNELPKIIINQPSGDELQGGNLNQNNPTSQQLN